MTGSNMWTDGNMLAGPLHDIFLPDSTAAAAGCPKWGWPGPWAYVGVSDPARGGVVRCATCDQVLLRLVRGPGRAWLDLRGLTYLQLPMTDET